MNNEKFNPREYAKEKVASRPQIDLERREIPSDVHCHVDEFCDAYLDGFDARQQDLHEKMRGMKL